MVTKDTIVKSKVWWPGKNPTKLIVIEGRLLPFKNGVDFFNYKRKWWLRYSRNHCTGSFKSKKAAMGWYNRGGR